MISEVGTYLCDFDAIVIKEKKSIFISDGWRVDLKS
jgi:hypothetical protein